MMKIDVKPLKGDTFQVEIDPESKVEELKKKIGEVKPEFPSEQQKLIYSGKILADATVIKDYGIKSGEFIVVMVAKPKAATPAPAASTSAQQPATAPSAPVAPASTPAAGGNTATAATTPAATTPPGDAPVSYETAASTLVAGDNMEPAVQQLCEMGFARPEVERCLRAAFGNPDRAAEYLMSGIPEGLLSATAAPPAGGEAPPPPAQATGGATPFPAVPAGGAAPFPSMMGGATEGAGDGADTLAELRNNPRFAELAQTVAQNPQVLGQILPVLAHSNPHIMQAIQANPAAFMRALQEAAGGGAAEPQDQDPVAAMLAAAQGGGGGQGAPPGGAPAVIRLTEEETAAVNRLVDLGFDRQMAAQAYLAFDKNEQAAANFLFENMDTSD